MRVRKRFLSGLAVLAAISLNAPVRAELVGWWTFDDVTGDVVPDSSTFNNVGTLMSGASISDDVPALLAGGHSLLLEGGDQHVLVEHDASLDMTEALTIAAWVKPIGNEAWDGILAKSPSDDSSLNHAGNYELRIENGTRTMTFLHQQGGVDDTIPYGGGPMIAELEWQHVAVTVDPDGITFYRNGLMHSTRPLTGFFGETNSNPLYIGSRADLFTGMNGLLDDVRLYNVALTADDIAALADAEVVPPIPGLIPASIYDVSSELTTNFGRGADNLVNGSGLFADGTHSITPDGTMWLNAGNGCCGDDADPLGPGAEITFDLGAEVNIDHMKLWNYNEMLPDRPELLQRGVGTMDIMTAGEDLVFSTLAAGVSVDSGSGDELVDFGQIFDFAGTKARYVKLSLLENLGGDNDFIGLSEVQFYKPSLGDFNEDGVLDTQDIDALSAAVRAGTNDPAFDLDGDGLVDDDDRNVWIDDIKKVWPGDADLSGEFNTGDLVQVFSRGQYEDAIDGNSGWGDGDWTGDGDFNTSDLVAAFQPGGYEQGPRAAVQAVPEPTSAWLLASAAALMLSFIRRR
ncbi:MAG: hypothetical protein KDA92_11965 [Planctomycetales bacterium]|nr:hypothetical protein [Planctomycetales bacterium]